MINLAGIQKHFIDSATGLRHQVLKGVSLSVQPGEFVAIMGHSGSGKTTLLNILGALDSTFEGTFTLCGQQIQGIKDTELSRIRRSHIGFVFQEFNLIPRLTALQNVLFPSWFSPKSELAPLGELSQRGQSLLERVGLAHKQNAYPHALSGGERQRVAIARAMFYAPKVLLCDEATGNLDPATSQEIRLLFRSLAQKDGVAVIAATHDPLLAQDADRALNLKDGLLVNA